MNTLERLVRGDPALYMGDHIVRVDDLPPTSRDQNSFSIITLNENDTYAQNWEDREDLIQQLVIVIGDDINEDDDVLVDIIFLHTEEVDTASYKKQPHALGTRTSGQITQNNQINKKLLLA